MIEVQYGTNILLKAAIRLSGEVEIGGAKNAALAILAAANYE